MQPNPRASRRHRRRGFHRCRPAPAAPNHSCEAPCGHLQRSPDAPVWGQVVVGPPGAGKTTYCAGMQQFLSLAGRRVAVVNLDPANDAALPYTPAVDVGELVSLEAVQEELGLGPNGGLVYCLEYLERNLDWLAERLAPLEEGECGWCWAWAGAGAAGRERAKVPGAVVEEDGRWCADRGRGGRVGMEQCRLPNACPLAVCLDPAACAEGCYLLFDLPGQVELFTLHGALRRILDVLTRRWQYRLTAVQLVDAHLCRRVVAAAAAAAASPGVCCLVRRWRLEAGGRRLRTSIPSLPGLLACLLPHRPHTLYPGPPSLPPWPQRPSQVPERPAAEPEHHAAPGAASGGRPGARRLPRLPLPMPAQSLAPQAAACQSAVRPFSPPLPPPASPRSTCCPRWTS